MMQFESLPNEILLEIFEYFDSLPLFNAFHNINSRFNILLYQLYRKHRFNFQYISKQDFQIVCQQYLPSILDRVALLCLVNSDITPNLPSIFLSFNFTFVQFIRLQSVTLIKLSNDETINVLNNIHYLKNLIYLNMIHCSIPHQDENTSYCWNQIWALPKLKHLVLTSFDIINIDFSKIIVVSHTLKYLSIGTTASYQYRNLIYLFQCTLYLQNLSIKIHCESINEINPIVFSSLTTLNFVFRNSLHSLNNLLQNMSNLCCLIIDMEISYFTGHECKQIITDHLSKLKIFRFKMHISFYNVSDKEKRIDEIIDTFRTPFWLVEHRWFVRCDWNSNSGLIYTLPYWFSIFKTVENGRSKWTSPDDKREYWIFHKVCKFISKISDEKQQLDIHPVIFPNIQELAISLPIHEYFCSSISTLKYLTSLCIFDRYRNETDLQQLFDLTPHLYEFIIPDPFKYDFLQLSKLRSKSIRRFYFYVSDRDFAPMYIVDDEDCVIFAQSSLGRQCEVLSGIVLKSSTNLIYLLSTMTNLRALTITCKTENLSSTTETKIKDCLLSQLPTTCSISKFHIYRDCISIALWIQ